MPYSRVISRMITLSAGQIVHNKHITHKMRRSQRVRGVLYMFVRRVNVPRGTSGDANPAEIQQLVT